MNIIKKAVACMLIISIAATTAIAATPTLMEYEVPSYIFSEWKNGREIGRAHV